MKKLIDPLRRTDYKRELFHKIKLTFVFVFI